MSKILIPYFNIATVSDVSATPVDYGAIVSTFEFRNVLDTKKDNYTLIWGNSDQPIIAELSGLSSLSAIIPDANTGVYLEYAPEAFYTGSGVNYIRRQSGASLGGLSTLDVLSYYGDYAGTASNDTDVLLSGGLTLAYDRKRTVFVTEGIDTSRYQLTLFGTNGSTGNGYNIKLYECMFGLIFDLPDGYYVEQMPQSVRDEGSSFFNKHFGGIDRYYLCDNQARDFTLEFENVNNADMSVLLNIFRYGYGCLPVLFMYDTADNATWRKIIMKNLTYSEPSHCMWNVSIDCSEVK